MKLNQVLRQKELDWWRARRALVLTLLVGGLAVGISLAAREHQQSEGPGTAIRDVDRTLAEGTRGTVPVPTETANGGTRSLSLRVNNLAPATSLPAYQIAIANPEGVRLKTIVTR